MTESDVKYLLAIAGEADFGGIGVTELARRRGLSKPSVSRALLKLETFGCVERYGHRKIKLTALGIETSKKYRLIIGEFEKCLRESFGLEEVGAHISATAAVSTFDKQHVDIIFDYIKENKKCP